MWLTSLSFLGLDDVSVHDLYPMAVGGATSIGVFWQLEDAPFCVDVQIAFGRGASAAIEENFDKESVTKWSERSVK
jgi:hypothetical protein